MGPYHLVIKSRSDNSNNNVKLFVDWLPWGSLDCYYMYAFIIIKSNECNCSQIEYEATLCGAFLI